MREGDSFILCGTLLVILIAIFCVAFLDPAHKKNTVELQKTKPIDRQTIRTSNVTGTVESIHPWGRTEIVSIKNVELEYYEYCDEWVMSGDVAQPLGRNGYFMPVMRGHLNLDVKDLTQTWTEYGSYATGPDNNAETYEDFRLAHIKVKHGKIIDVEYTHYRLLSNKTWNVIASWKAQVNPDIPEPIPSNVIKDDVPIIVCGFCKGKGERLTDVNKLMMDASLALFINHHLNVDKCEKCVKLPYGDAYEYCDTVESKYQILLQEYAAVGPKKSMAACSECMGMGTFNSKDLSTGKWHTQETWDKQHSKENQHE